MLMGFCCCDDCDIADDDFSSADALADGWEEDTGDFTKASGEVTSTTASKFLINKTAHPAGGSDGGTAVAGLKGNTDGDKARVILWLDSSNYFFAELEVNSASGNLRIGESVSGSETVLASVSAVSADLNNEHTVRICYDSTDDVLSTLVTFSDSTQDGLDAQCSAIAVDQAGIATGDTAAGTLTFDNFDYDRVRDATHENCPSCVGPTVTTCADWNNAEVPDTFKVVIAGFADDTCPSDTCTDLNRVYVVPYLSSCEWILGFDQPDCFGLGSPNNTVQVLLQKSGADFILVVDISLDFGGTHQFRKNFGPTAPDATAFLNELIPNNGESVADTFCDGSAATCKITSI